MFLIKSEVLFLSINSRAVRKDYTAAAYSAGAIFSIGQIGELLRFWRFHERV